jgi:hypothetical protein
LASKGFKVLPLINETVQHENTQHGCSEQQGTTSEFDSGTTGNNEHWTCEKQGAVMQQWVYNMGIDMAESVSYQEEYSENPRHSASSSVCFICKSCDQKRSGQKGD